MVVLYFSRFCDHECDDSAGSDFKSLHSHCFVPTDTGTTGLLNLANLKSLLLNWKPDLLLCDKRQHFVFLLAEYKLDEDKCDK